jgi:hypothetical protein
MEPFVREGKTVRWFQLLPASGGWGARLNSKTNISELLINPVIFDKPKMLIGFNQKVSDGLLVCFLRAQGQKRHRGRGRVYPIPVTGVEHGKPVLPPEIPASEP